MNSQLAHQYAAIKDELESQEDLRAESGKRRWMSYEVRLPVVIAAFAAQFLLGAVIILVIAHRSHQFMIPIDSQLRDTLGNYYPAAAAIKYELRTFHYNTTFVTTTGIPTARTDLAWKEMQAPTDGTIQASYSKGFQVDSLPQTIHAKNDATQWMYGLEVFHQLHCLDYIRQSFYPGHYFPNETKHDVVYHREHCIEHLRQSIICSGDFSLDYWKHDEETGKNWLKTDVTHVCRDFGAMREWVIDNQWDNV